jgi:hypothetical protein
MRALSLSCVAILFSTPAMAAWHEAGIEKVLVYSDGPVRAGIRRDSPNCSPA